MQLVAAGQMDDLRIYNRALSAAEIQSDRNAECNFQMMNRSTSSTEISSPGEIVERCGFRTGKMNRVKPAGWRHFKRLVHAKTAPQPGPNSGAEEFVR